MYPTIYEIYDVLPSFYRVFTEYWIFGFNGNSGVHKMFITPSPFSGFSKDFGTKWPFLLLVEKWWKRCNVARLLLAELRRRFLTGRGGVARFSLFVPRSGGDDNFPRLDDWKEQKTTSLMNFSFVVRRCVREIIVNRKKKTKNQVEETRVSFVSFHGVPCRLACENASGLKKKQKKNKLVDDTRFINEAA